MSRQHITRCDVAGCDQAKGNDDLWAKGNDDLWWAIVCFDKALIVSPHRFSDNFGASSVPSEAFGARKARLDACCNDHMRRLLGREAAKLGGGGK